MRENVIVTGKKGPGQLKPRFGRPLQSFLEAAVEPLATK